MPKKMVKKALKKDVYASLYDPFKKGFSRKRAIRVKRYDRCLEKRRRQIVDPSDVRRARDWAFLADQVVGKETCA